MVPSLPFYAFFSGMLSLIGHQLTGFDDANGNKSFSEKSTAEKLNQIVSYLLTIGTILIVCCMGRIARKKMVVINREEKQIRGNRKKYKLRFDKYRLALEDKPYEKDKVSRKLNYIKKTEEQIDIETQAKIKKDKLGAKGQ
jgi:hypothetical protein